MNIAQPSFLQGILFRFFDGVDGFIGYWKSTETPREKLFCPSISHGYRPPSRPIEMFPPDDPNESIGYPGRPPRS